MYLHKAAPPGSDINTSYKQAVYEFYNARKEQEQVEEEARKAAFAAGMEAWKSQEEKRIASVKANNNMMPSSSDPAPLHPEYFHGRQRTLRFVERERQEIEQGLEHRNQLLETVKLTGNQNRK